MANRFRFTKKELESLPPCPPGKRQEFYDTEVPKLLLRVTGNGTKTFYVRRKMAGTDRVLIGPFPDLSVEQARKMALEISSVIAHGQNPNDSKRTARAELTFGELLDAYLEGHARQKCQSWQEMAAVFRRYLSDWRPRLLSKIKRSDAQSRLNEIGAHNGKVPANHTLTYARAAINWCIANELTTTENPWVGIKKFKTAARERFIHPEELVKFFENLDKIKKDARDYILVSLFTGARRSNVLSMRWDQIDFALGTWTIPRTKNGDSQTLPLTQRVIDILGNRRTDGNKDWVFPGNGSSGHMVEPKKSWHKLLELSELSDLRLHDLRRTLGSYMAMGNQSLHVIGKALGHKSASATQIYSRMTYDPIRQAVDKAQSDILLAAGATVEATKSGSF